MAIQFCNLIRKIDSDKNLSRNTQELSTKDVFWATYSILSNIFEHLSIEDDLLSILNADWIGIPQEKIADLIKFINDKFIKFSFE